jgi:hypothetical protein
MPTGRELDLQLSTQHVTGVLEKTIFQSVTEYNKHLSTQCNLPAQIEQVRYKIGFNK